MTSELLLELHIHVCELYICLCVYRFCQKKLYSLTSTREKEDAVEQMSPAN